jgi:hypothetical protein
VIRGCTQVGVGPGTASSLLPLAFHPPQRCVSYIHFVTAKAESIDMAACGPEGVSPRSTRAGAVSPSGAGASSTSPAGSGTGGVQEALRAQTLVAQACELQRVRASAPCARVLRAPQHPWPPSPFPLVPSLLPSPARLENCAVGVLLAMQSVAELSGVYCTVQDQFMAEGVSMAISFDEVRSY